MRILNKSALSGMFLFTALILCFTGISIYTIGCSDEPSSLGLNLIPPGDTAGIRVFDSYIDSMQIIPTSHRRLTNTSSSGNLMVGKTTTHDSKALLQYYDLSPNYDSATVVSARLILKYRNYYFPSSNTDSLGQVSFDVFKINKSLDLDTITLTSIDNNTFGTTSQGNFSGSPAEDSAEVSINLNTAMIKDWLEYEADTSYSVKNYGMGLLPQVSSNVIKGFYSPAEGTSGLKPKLQIIVTKNNDTDTLTYDATNYTSLANTTISQTSELFFLQSGVAYIQVLKFDITKIPSTATINDVQLYLTLDPANSELSNQASKVLYAARVTDTAGLKTDPSFYISTGPTNNIYVIRLVKTASPSPFQQWLLGETNYGLYINPTTIQQNLDLYAFYNTTASDPAKRPRIVIKYTPRVTQ